MSVNIQHPTPLESARARNTKRSRPYNLIFDTDSYKYVHYRVLPEGAQRGFLYLESRGGKFDQVMFFGLQYILQQYLTQQVTHAMVDEAKILINKHFGYEIFNEAGWRYIVDHCEGYCPVTIKAVEEGSVVPTKNVLLTIQCDDPNALWIIGHLEPMILRVWASITTATKSFTGKRIITKAADISSDDCARSAFEQMYKHNVLSQHLLKFHDFGARGGSSYETVSWSGMGHTANFLGSDTVGAIVMAADHYDCDCAAFSIPATEHSIKTALGPGQGEIDITRRVLKQFGNFPIFADVIDGYDTMNALKHIWGGVLKDEAIASNAHTIVMRPDSGHPVEMPLKVVDGLAETFGTVKNKKGFNIINKFRVIQGDGIDLEIMEEICDEIIKRGYAIDNIAFGMGGGLIQSQTRDTLKFAAKCSWLDINGVEHFVFKDPITDPGKTSKKGMMILEVDENGEFFTTSGLYEDQYIQFSPRNKLRTVYSLGWLENQTTLERVRLLGESFV